MFRVIINADDLGASLKVNSAIEGCIKRGEITSSTIMAGGDALDDAVRIAETFTDISFGVHLTLDEFDSISKSNVLFKYGLTDENGAFLKNGYKKVERYTKELKSAIYEEWNEQIRSIRERGVVISHADGHHHCHTVLSLKEVLHDVLKNNGIKKVRLPQSRTFRMRLDGIYRTLPNKKVDLNGEIQKSESNKASFHRAFLGSLKEEKKLFFYKHHFQTTDFFTAAAFFQEYKDYLLKHYPNMTIELMCHPGHPDYDEETHALNGMCEGCYKINYNQL